MATESEGMLAGDNGHDPEKAKKELTPEELKKERLERYMKEPEKFVELDSVVCMIIKNPTSGLGVSAFVGNVPRTLLDIAQAELVHLMNKIRLQMDVASEMRHKALMPQPGAMHRFANKIRGR